MRGLFLLTMKPVTYAANVAEGDLGSGGAGNLHVEALREKAAQEGREVVIVSAQVHRRRPGVCGGTSHLHTDRLLDSTAPNTAASTQQVSFLTCAGTLLLATQSWLE